mmetsp:Transcript_23713/g.23474  ORF Transcript_23713/g.23474 Transcript_23713/m.23474 type:complete len:268 (-) Transcript_23713:29-832(-)
MGCCGSSQVVAPPPAPISIKIDPTLPPAEQEAQKVQIDVRANKIAAAQKLELDSEEKIIRSEEKKIPFAQKKARDLDQALKANSLEGKLSVPQLKRATAHLEINPDIFTDPDLAVYKFLKKFSEGRLYEVKSLALCGILLGQGSNKEKAEVLFDHFDIDASGKLDKEELRKMLDDMVILSAEKAPIAAIGEGLLTEEQASAYSKKLIGAKEGFIRTIIEVLVQAGEDGISKIEFEKKVSGHPTLQRLLWSYGIRQSLFEEANDVFAL